MKKDYYDCGVIGNKLYVARDNEHHYITKFTLDGEFRMTNKRLIMFKIIGNWREVKVNFSMGYYKNSVKLNRRLNKKVYEALINKASGY